MKVPFAYDLDIRLTTGPRVRRTYREYLDFEVPTVAPVAFPVAFSRPGINDQGWENPEELRIHDGRFYKALSANGMDGARRLSLEDLEIAVGRCGVNDHHVRLNCQAILKASTVKLKGPPKASSIEYGINNREDAIKSVTRTIERYLLCDGELYVAVPEPILQLSRNSCCFLILDGPGEIKDHPISFRVTDVDAARSFAAAYYLETPSRVAFPEFKVHIPDAFRAAFEHTLHATIGYLRDEVGRDLPHHPLSVMGAFCDLRDATRFLGGDRVHDPITQISAARALCDELEVHGLREALVRQSRLCLARAEIDSGLDLTADDLAALAI